MIRNDILSLCELLAHRAIIACDKYDEGMLAGPRDSVTIDELRKLAQLIENMLREY